MKPATANPWYREPWPWILMAGPAAVVVAGFVTLWIAVKTDDGLVADDYYKQGLAVNQLIARVERARELQLAAQLGLVAGRIEIELSSASTAPPPDRLKVTLAHPTRRGLDRSVTLELRDGRYAAPLAAVTAGRWQVAIEDEPRSWRLTGSLQIPDATRVEIVAPPSPAPRESAVGR